MNAPVLYWPKLVEGWVWVDQLHDRSGRSRGGGWGNGHDIPRGKGNGRSMPKEGDESDFGDGNGKGEGAKP